MPVVINGSTGITSPGGDVSSADNTINGVRVGEGGGSLATNTVLGTNALAAVNTVGFNVAVGTQALAANTSGDSSVGVGYRALFNNTTGYQNSAFGANSLQANTTGFANSALGGGALIANTTGTNNTALGYYSLQANTTASNNTAVGYRAAYSNTTGAGLCVFGIDALYNNTTGNFNSVFGRDALNANSTGSGNTALGYQAMLSNTTASNNTAVGYQAGYSNTTGVGVTAIGYKALNLSTGSYNTSLGIQAGENISSGTYNTCVGAFAGSEITTGGKNTIIGRYNGNQGGLDIRTASNYIVLSDGDGNPRQIVDGSGNFGIGINPNGFYTAKVNIFANVASGYALGMANDGNNVNRKGLGISAGTYDSSGTSTMIDFADGDGNLVGNITNAGGTVSYNAFLGAHYTEVQGETTALVGTVYDSVDELVEHQYSSQDRLPKVKVSDVAESTSVYGVYLGDSSWNDKTESITGILVASVGAGWVRIAQGVTVQKGDLLVSNGDGCAKIQSDDIVRSKTIGKVVSNIAVETYPDGSYIVPTVLYCG